MGKRPDFHLEERGLQEDRRVSTESGPPPLELCSRERSTAVTARC